jgi:hypothetical protein
MAASLPERRRFRRALDDPRASQSALLGSYLRRNRDTAIGCELGFADILQAGAHHASNLVDAYRARVPLVTYDDLAPFVARIREGEQGVLTRSPVHRFVPSSGSTAARKLVPFTRELQAEFSRAVDPWIADLFLTHPAARAGRAYWSISPAIPRDESGAVPVGFDNDSEYLGGARRALARAVLAVPDAITRVTNPDGFRYISLVFLLRARDLRLISIWHPSFLTRLLEGAEEWLPSIAADISRGSLTPPGDLHPDLLVGLRRHLRPDPRRARELLEHTSFAPRGLWPHLTLVSCWQDGCAAWQAAELAQTLPGVVVQGKGLLATEGVVSIPFRGRRPLAIRSHFFEFLDGSGTSHLADELRDGAEYAVVLTTGGGLYRYRLGDRIRVEGHVGRTPSIRFVGRDDRVSDRFGEKLSESFAAGVIARLFAEDGAPRFAMLAPEPTPRGIAYTLFLEADSLPPDLDGRLERELRRNPQYAWCVDLGQLRPARVVRVGPGSDRRYVDACVARGQRAGDVKPAALDLRGGWRSLLPVQEPEPVQ